MISTKLERRYPPCRNAYGRPSTPAPIKAFVNLNPAFKLVEYLCNFLTSGSSICKISTLDFLCDANYWLNLLSDEVVYYCSNDSFLKFIFVS